MSSGIVRLVRGLGLAVVLTASVAIAPSGSHQVSPAGESASGRLAPEVRLRKLHLVRPDLIPYPVSYDVYC